MSLQRDSRPGQLSLHQSADNFTVPLNDTAPMVPLVLERQKGETQLWVKELKVDKQRYIVGPE